MKADLRRILKGLLENIVKRNVFPVMQSLHFVAHVSEQKAVLIRFDFQAALQ